MVGKRGRKLKEKKWKLGILLAFVFLSVGSCHVGFDLGKPMVFTKWLTNEIAPRKSGCGWMVLILGVQVGKRFGFRVGFKTPL